MNIGNGQKLIVNPTDYEVNVGSTLTIRLRKSTEIYFPTYYKMRTAPKDAILDEVIGKFTWTPRSDDVGIRGVIFNLVDTSGTVLSEEIVTIQVKNKNNPPVIALNSISVNGEALDSHTNSVKVKEKDKVHITAYVLDENPERLFLSHYFNGDVNQRELRNASVHYNAATKEIDFKFQPAEEQARNGYINWSINAVDEIGNTGVFNLRMDIEDVDFPPVILNKPTRKNIKDDFSFVFEPRIDNDDDDILRFTFEHDQEIRNINLDDNTGKLTWEISSSEMVDDKIYRIKFIVAESHHPHHSDEVTLEIAWSETNKKPQIKAIPGWNVKEGITHNYKIIAEDPNLDDELEYSLAGGYELSGLSVDKKSGVLSYTPPYDMVTQKQGAVDLQIAFQVMDKKGEVTTGQIPVKIYDRPNPDDLKNKLDNLNGQLKVMITRTSDIKDKAEYVDSKLRAKRRNTTIALSAVSLAGAIFAGLPSHTVLSKLAPGIVGGPAAYGLVNNLNAREEDMVDKLRRQSNDLYTILNHKHHVLERYKNIDGDHLSNDPEFIALINRYNRDEELLELNAKLNEIKSNYELLRNQKRYKRLFEKYEKH